MSLLFLPIFRREVRQDDICVIGVMESSTGPYLPPIDTRLPCRDHRPAMESGAPGGCGFIGDRNGFVRRRGIESVYRDSRYAWPLQKDVMRNSCASSPIPMSARKYAPAKPFLLADLIGVRHVAGSSCRSSSARASRTNPSGSPRESE